MVVAHRGLVIGLTVAITGLLGLQVRHLRVIIDVNALLPTRHPYVEATRQVEQMFGSRYVVVIGITAKNGDALTADLLGKVQRITTALRDAPGLVKGKVVSLTARQVKSIAGTADGMEARPMLATLPRTPAEVDALRRAIRGSPAYVDAIVSRDERTAAVLAECDRGPDGFRGIVTRIQAIVDRERDESVEIAVSGQPVYVAQIERYSQRMLFLFPLAVVITGLIHYEAFRTIQGLVLPLVTALLAVLWGLGIMGWAGVSLDALNVTTPILILAVAAGHAVQILKRYYEEYHRLRATAAGTPRDANREATIESLVRTGPVMLTAGAVAALGFLSLVSFDSPTIRTFGVFTGMGILSALVLEMTFIPALRSWLPPPGEREGRREREHRGFDRAAEVLARWVTGPARGRVLVAWALMLAVAAIGIGRVVVDNSNKSYFFASLPFQKDDAQLNARLGGTNTLYVLVEGREEDAIKAPAVLRAIDATQRLLEAEPDVGKTLSLVDFVKRMNRAMHEDDPAYDVVPESRELIAQYLFLYSLSGEPGDLDSYVDYAYQSANIWAFLKTDSTSRLEALVTRLNTFVATSFPSDVRVRIGGNVPLGAALNEAMARGKLLNILQIAGVILLLTSVLFRSLLAGLLVMVPLVGAVVMNFGIMGWTGIRLNIATSVISAMAVGIGADYAIYLIYRIREESVRSADETTAVRVALTTAGKAILFVASAVAGGYGVLLLSWGFYIHIWFAILIALAMLVSSLGALTLLTSLILVIRPRFVFRAGPRSPAPLAAVVLAAASLTALPGAAAQESPSVPAAPAAPGATEMMERSYGVNRVLDAAQEATFTLINARGQERVRKTVGLTKLRPNGIDNMRLVRFVAPPDVKGTATLLIERAGGDDDMWVYVPALQKVRRLVASNKRDSFVGTDFSYGDVIGHRVDEWRHRRLDDDVADGAPCYRVESLPRDEAIRSSSGYSRRISWIRKDNFYSVRSEFWDESDKPVKTFRAADLRLVDPARQKWQAMRLEMANLQTGHRTVLQLDAYRANQGVADDLFTQRALERGP